VSQAYLFNGNLDLSSGYIRVGKAPFTSFGSFDRTQIVRSNYAARRPRIQARIVTKRPTTQGRDAQLNRPAFHLATPRATG
jgi:hypothetical protein